MVLTEAGFQIVGDDGTVLDAVFELMPDAVVLQSRGGAKSAPDARNTQYAAGLRLLLKRLRAADVGFNGAWVDSQRVQPLPLSQRCLLLEHELGLPVDSQLALITSRMKSVGQQEGAAGGNPTKRLRLGVDHGQRLGSIVGRIAGTFLSTPYAPTEHIPHSILRTVSPGFVKKAVEDLARGRLHPFADSTDYDVLLADGTRLPPKAVFGVAATDAFGFVVGPGNFNAGFAAPAFEMIERAGFTIVRKDDPNHPLPTPEPDQDWREGNIRLRKHLRRERAAGLSKAKKLDFATKHGRLFCERCKMDPARDFSPEHGEAVIEVHHASTQVKDMAEGHKTGLADLRCLCANCHRYVHRLLRHGLDETF